MILRRLYPTVMPHSVADSQPAKTAPPAFESWGRYPKYDAKLVPLNWQGEFPSVLAGLRGNALPVGLAAATAMCAC